MTDVMNTIFARLLSRCRNLNDPARDFEPRSFTAILISGLFALLLMPGSCATVQAQQVERGESLEDFRRKVEAFMPAKSSAGHFLIVCEDKMVAQLISVWAEDVVSSIERDVGLKTLFAGSPVEIEISGSGGTGTVTAIQRFSDNRLQQRLVVTDLENVDFMSVLEPLCRLLLDRYAIAGQTEADRAVKLAAAPEWLVAGLAQNLSVEQRGANSNQIHVRWKSAKLEKLDKFMRNGSARGSRPDREYSSVLVQWHEWLPEKARVFELLFAAISAGEQVTPEVMMRYVPGCETADDVDEAWDKWLLKQGSTIYQPGVADRKSIDRLEAELLLYEGDSGIPLAGNLNRRFSMGALLDMADQKWIPSFCAAKNQRLQAVAIGRGKQFSDVVQAYRLFLAALKSGRDRASLAKLLAGAEAGLAALKAQVEKPTAVEDSQDAVKEEKHETAAGGQDAGR